MKQVCQFMGWVDRMAMRSTVEVIHVGDLCCTALNVMHREAFWYVCKVFTLL